jgi:1-acyl-sn-glycerol-3-phosphate acyltransferase
MPETADVLASNSPAVNWLRNALYVVLRAWLRLCWGYAVEGAEHLRIPAPFVLIANHASHADAVALLAALPAGLRNRCYSAAAEDYFYGNPIRRLGARLFANTFPFRRHGPGAELSLAACANILARGDCLILYPEGTRTTTGRLQRFRKGIGVLVQGTPYPVIPVWIEGTREVLGKGRGVPRLCGRIRLRVGAPQRFGQVGPDDDAAVDIANALRERVAALSPNPEDHA